jgi:hypothetical protein
VNSKFIIKKKWKEARASNTQGHENYKEPSILQGGNLEYGTCTQSIDYILME